MIHSFTGYVKKTDGSLFVLLKLFVVSMLSRKIVRCHETDFFAVFSYSLKALQLLLGSVFRRCFSHITDPEELRLTAELEELDVFPVCAP